MKILIYYPEPLFPINSGGRNRIYNLANNLSANNTILLIAYNSLLKQNAIRKTINNNFQYLEAKRQSILDKLTFKVRRLLCKKFVFVPSHWQYFKQFNPDIIISEHCFSFFQCYFYAKKHEIPIILDQQNFESELFPQYPYYRFKFWEKLSLKKSNYITCCSEIDKNKFINLLPAIKHKISVIENGINLNVIKPDLSSRNKIRNKLGFKNNDFVFCFHGSANYRPNKEALNYIYKNLKDFKIILFGRDMPNKKIGNVISLGCIEPLNDYLNACDAGIAPLISGSGTRIKILEYFACAKPVISTMKGAEGIKYQNNFNIIISNLDNFPQKMKILAQNKSLQQSIGNNARILAKNNYIWKTIANKLGKVIQHHFK